MFSYFTKRHLLSNVIFFGVIFAGIFTWNIIGKEEMPEFASNWVRVTTIYPGAPAEDVELFVTKPIEDELKGVVGLEEISATSSLGQSSFRIVLDDNYPDKDDVLRDIQDAVLRARLPSEVRDLPNIRQFKSSEKAILDIGIYHKGAKKLDTRTREELQLHVLNFENQLLALKEISSISKSHYRKPELKILVDPKKMLNKQISISQIKKQIQADNIRAPIGSLVDKGESKVTAMNELESVDSLNSVILQGNYSGAGVKLKDIAKIERGHEKVNSIFKINGNEGIFLNIKKSVSTDILTAHKAVKNFIDKFKKNNSNSPIDFVMMDDESYAVRNRLNIISSNGVLGFAMIIIVLLLFLDVKTGFWVAMGIPFSMAFTLIVANYAGYTVNNMTLAGIIIVLGIVVDDAIIIAENISRHKEEGKSPIDAAIIGTKEVFKPIVASITTTCIAFLPLLYFEGFFGKLVTYIPLIIILMLIASLIESIFVLPAHLAGKTFILDRLSVRRDEKVHWFIKIEKLYQSMLTKIIKNRILYLALFLSLIIGAGWIFHSKMKFVMFPREESKEVFIKVKADKNSTREETSSIIGPLEEFLAADTDNIVGVRSSIGVSRRGGTVKENEASILVEIFPADERKTSLNKLLKKWESFSDTLEGFESIKYQRGRWGHGSGNAIEIQIQENNDESRDAVARKIKSGMESLKLIDIEIDDPIKKQEFILQINQANLIRFNVTASNVVTVLRSFVEGSILYSINKGEEEIDVRLSVPDSSKDNLNELLNLRVENSSGNLVFLRKIVDIKKVVKPLNITRTNFKRTTMMYANISKDQNVTPLEVAEKLENEIFPDILKNYPSTNLFFTGEIEDTRESQGQFTNSIYVVIGLIFLVLIVLFNSIAKSLLVLLIVPFGISGVVYILFAHGMSVYGFFSAIGALGMIGVVVNDAIVMIDKIDNSVQEENKSPLEILTTVCSTRLRPVLLTTITTVVGVLPTAYGIAGYDSMLAEMMLVMGWGLAFGTIITLILVPILYSFTLPKEKLGTI